ncbi:dipeptidyl aminopeptidase/acylaminoacyl peptidase [Mesorhizobium soli]|uniref:prolyl oligopeptidase family serine peptidase n=1 Tax=Pseudaminobacter soli (ex Li et al. 2025) TaxID=1295366 RepID=UPI002473088F|nr:prolyl oligopeptidase family serine peptidase [Mesorhizobium soli]MDH6233573.1 dipeptidyl aminopeptidase/acylaminoacyl peptidase [Mesorhizobium soli]
MDRDFRSSPDFVDTHAFYSALLAPGGHVYGARMLCGHENAAHLHFLGQSFEGAFEDGVSSRLYRVARQGGSAERLNDRETRQIRLSPDGQTLAVASAGDEAGVDLIETWSDGRLVAVQLVPGRIEQIDWSPDGTTLLLVVAGTGADLAGIHGGYTQKSGAGGHAWLPEVRSDEGSDLWRTIWTWEGEGGPKRLTQPPLNVWEASWCGNGLIAAIASDHHSEGAWYKAHLSLIDAASGAATKVFQPADQLGSVKGAPDGRHVAFVQAFCSDRGLVSGLLSILDPKTGTIETLDTRGIDASSVEWRSPTVIHFAGERGHQIATGDYDLERSSATESWSSSELTNSEWVPTSYPIGESGALFVGESYARAPFLAEVVSGVLREVASLAAPTAQDAMSRCGAIEPFAWTAPDGMEIQGWVVRPKDASGPTPLLVDVHGGPISAHRNSWMARKRSAPILASRGWTIFFPNPRGSTGRGDAFARAVKGDMGGADTHDIIAGVDALIAKGWVDAKRIAVTGTSYGGFMSAWLPSQTDRFAAAIPISPVGNWYSQHRTTQIPEFDEIMLDASPWAEGGAYFTRSPAFYKQKTKVPTLVMAGGIDRSTPVGQAEECHFAAVRSGAPSSLVIYPKAGHSVRSYPEYLDSAARILWWLGKYVRPAE